MINNKRTEIAELGEFGLIEHLTNSLKPQNSSTVYGVGDDAAVLDYKDKEVLVTTDMLMEGSLEKSAVVRVRTSANSARRGAE